MVYSKNKTRPIKNVLLSGPYGGLNIGDDAIAEAIINRTHSESNKITLASPKPDKSKLIFGQVSNHRDRLNLRNPTIDSLKGIKSTDCLIIGGGEQLAEARIRNPIWGHLATTCHQVLLAKLFNKRICLLGIGAPKEVSAIGKILLRNSLRFADIISARDINTKNFLSKLLNRRDIILGADPVLEIKRQSKSECKEWLDKVHPIDPQKTICLIIPVQDKIINQMYLEEINKFVLESNDSYQFIYFCTDRQKDYDLTIQAEGKLAILPHSKWFNSPNPTTDTLAKLCAASDIVISARMHGLIFSLTQNTPCISISRSKKMETFCTESNTRSIRLIDLSCTKLKRACTETLADSRFFKMNLIYLNQCKARNDKQFEQLAELISRDSPQ